jgi:hypothetical protein
VETSENGIWNDEKANRLTAQGFWHWEMNVKDGVRASLIEDSAGVEAKT